MKNPPRSSWADLISPVQTSGQHDAGEMLRKLDELQQAISLLRRGEAIPPEIATWLAAGFELFINEGGKLGDRLGLGVRRGGRFQTVTTLNALKRRDQLLLILVHESPYIDIDDKIAAAAAFLNGRGPAPVKGLSDSLKRMIKQIRAPIPGKRRLAQIVKQHMAEREMKSRL